MKKEKLIKKLDKYFSDWAVEVSGVVEKKAEKENWDWFDFVSGVTFMLMDIKADMIKYINKLK